MRKWYGQAEREVLEAERREEDKDPGPGPEQEPVSSGNAVLVTDADTPIGEQVIDRIARTPAIATAARAVLDHP